MPAQPLYHEKALLDQIAQGDENAFRTIFDHYRDAIYSFALKVLRHEAMAEETVQDVFLKIWINRAGLSAIRNFADFLYIVARNHTFNSLRKLARERRICTGVPDDLQIEGVSAEAMVLQRDYDRVLQQAIALLPPQQKLVYTLSRQHGLSRDEIAEQMNISAGTVKAHMAQALRSVRTYFKNYENSILSLIAAVLLMA